MKKWQQFEDDTHKIVQELNQKAKVYRNVTIEGKLSKVQREVDVQLIKPEQYDFIAFECKDYKRPLDVHIVEEFNTKLLDIEAKKGAIVSNSPFSQAAQNMAKELNIDLLNLINTSNKQLCGKLFAQTLITDTFVKRLSIRLGSAGQPFAILPAEPDKIILVDDSGNEITAYQIFASLWNESDDLIIEAGEYLYYPPNQNNKRIKDLNGNIITLNRLAFRYRVVKKYFFGKIQIIETRGLYNPKEQSFQSKSLQTERLDVAEAEKNWKEISEEEAKSLFGKYTFGMEVISMLPPNRIK